MIDIQLILENKDLVHANNVKRNKDIDIEETISLHKDYLAKKQEIDTLRESANKTAKQIPTAKEDEKQDLIKTGKIIKLDIKSKEEALKTAKTKLSESLLKYPNILKDDVVEGSEENNVIERTIGEPKNLNFKVKDHIELGELHDIIDIERASKVSGSRFSYLKGDAVKLELALIQYTLNILEENGFKPVTVPHMISKKAMAAMGYLNREGDEEIYHLRDDDQVLIGTSEHAMGAMYMDEIIPEENLPIRMAGFSPCYRREAGSYGKDVKGILRSHQFDKIEMFSFTSPENSETEHELILKMQETLMQGLELPYRVVRLAANDTGSPSAKTWDIETWIPSQSTYRETHSTSNTTDYQTRRLNTRISKEGKNITAHALNGTAFAIGRILIAILENNQQEDGSIAIPQVLQSYMNKKMIKNV